MTSNIINTFWLSFLINDFFYGIFYFLREIYGKKKFLLTSVLRLILKFGNAIVFIQTI